MTATSVQTTCKTETFHWRCSNTFTVAEHRSDHVTPHHDCNFVVF